MEGALLPLSSTSSSKLNHRFSLPSTLLLKSQRYSHFPKFFSKSKFDTSSSLSIRCSTRNSTLSLDRDNAFVSENDKFSTDLPKVDKSGRFCSPRAARELALSIIYASCLEGLDPVRLFEKRMNARRGISP